MASMTVAVCGAPVAALSVASATSTSTSARASLAAPSLKNRITARPAEWASKTVSNGSRVNAFNVVNPDDNIRFETLSFLPPLTDEQVIKQVEYVLRNKWVPAIEFDKLGVVSQTALHLPTYYDGRYWSMWKLPLFGATDAADVLGEVQNCQKLYPDSFIRVIGFDSKRQVQVVSFIVKKPGQS